MFGHLYGLQNAPLQEHTLERYPLKPDSLLSTHNQDKVDRSVTDKKNELYII